MQDNLILITIILFVLSLISERIANFFKLYLPEDQRFLCIIPPGKFRTKQDDEYEEKCRTRRVFVIALLSGFAVALFLKADIIDIFNASANPQETLGWDNLKYPAGANGFQIFGTVLASIFGCLLTGFFLSFGSKFWHDLLDLLLEAKNLRRKLVDEKTYQIETSEELIKHLKIKEGEIVNRALNENYATIKSIKGVTAVGKGLMLINGKKSLCVQVNVDSDATKSIIRPYLVVKFDNEAYEAPVHVIVSGVAKIHLGAPGGKIFNKRNSSNGGTLGCIVKDIITNDEYILTCYHVLRTTHRWSWFSPINEEEILDENLNPIGSLITGIRNEHLDVGLAKCVSSIPNLISAGIGKPKTIRKIEPIDESFETPVKLKGMTNSSVKSGIIYNDCIDVTLLYGDGSSWHLRDTFAITKRIGEQLFSVTQPGDSGAIVVDDNNEVIGMIVGGDESFSYAIPMTKIAEQFGIDLA